MTNKIYLFAATAPCDAKALSAALTYEGSRRFFALTGAAPDRVQKLENGKPVFAGGKFFLSLSHSENAFLAAFAEIPVGVDLEKRGKIRRGVAAKYFSPEEQKSDFFSVWTKKEALAKLTGAGIAALAQIKLTDTGARLAGKEYPISDLSAEYPQKGFAAALAAESDGEIEVQWL